MASEETSLHTDLPASGHPTRSTLRPAPTEPDTPEPDAHWTFFHKPIIVMVMGGLMSGVGAALLLVHSLGATEAPHAATPACLAIGLVLVALGLVWIPILREKLRRRGSSGVATDGDAWERDNN